MTKPADDWTPERSSPNTRPKLDLISDPADPTPGLPAKERRSRDSHRDLGRNNDPHAETPAGDRSGRPFVGVQFECCGIYARIYRNAAATAYAGNCPRCAKKIELKIGPGGSDSRFFTVQ
jgi:hypothetical protein